MAVMWADILEDDEAVARATALVILIGENDDET